MKNPWCTKTLRCFSLRTTNLTKQRSTYEVEVNLTNGYAVITCTQNYSYDSCNSWFKKEFMKIRGTFVIIREICKIRG